MNAILFLIFTLLSIFGVVLNRSIWLSNPVIGFLFFNWVMGVGSFLLLDLDITADYVHAWVVLLSPLFFSLGASVVSTIFPIEKKYKNFWSENITSEVKQTEFLALMFLVLSIVVVVIYYKAVGYNLFTKSLLGGVDDFTTMRLQSYAGDNYVAAGYVNQFKNTMLPVLFLFFSLVLRKSKIFLLYITVGGLFLLWALMGTGQRTFLVMAFLIYFNFYLIYKSGNVPLKFFMISLPVVLFMFVTFSVSLGRIEDGGIASGFEQLLHRVFASNQLSSIVGFQYIYNLELQSGYDWFKSIVGILPGVKGSDIANQIHYILFRSDRGTAPLSIWGSAFYNFGMLGTYIFAYLYGAICQLSYYRFISGGRGLLRLCCYSALIVYLSSWISNSPIQLINNGLLAVIFLLILRKVRWNNETSTTRHG
ncbi:O-antigen polymerase [Vibrio sp. Y58_MX_L22]|uniref:O-antigen polymerase n=1 Tax=Vibrio sp. Y58_MX_L22 TaxID=2957763 RepID=UPI0020A2D4AC|nr:O-antigen polymerase [Vibrio sp. Y58_MX_L22]